ncbi:hypothetical protein AWB75_07059 [Caballeronia catudaia]|uniref:Uncharacterized protein n=1 Tax=Caballeronia catudaia TaxID=1777136 RepID=A0A158DQW5_9BURK|nr:hypothetical protein AWB75_07059 [Caballeronia catudaia]
MPAAASQTSTLTDGLRAPSDSLTPSSRTFGGGEPILSGPYDPSRQEALLKAARSARASAVGDGDGRSGGFDWLGAAEAAAGALLGGTASGDDSGDSMLKSFTDGDADDGGSLLDDALPFEYVPAMPGDDVLDLAGADGRPGNNQAQNKQTNDVARILRLTPDQAQQLHYELGSEPPMGFHEIMERAKDMFNLW